MSPQAQRRASAKIIPGAGPTIWDEGAAGATEAIALKFTRSAPSVVASVLGTVFGGGPLGFTLAAGQTAGQVYNDARDNIEKMPSDELAQRNQLYAGYLSLGMSESQAREKLLHETAANKALIMGTVTYVTSKYMGIEGQIERRMGEGAVRGRLASAAGEAAQESTEQVAQSALGHAAATEATGDKPFDWHDAANQTIESGLIGGLMGGALGGGKRRTAATLRDQPETAPAMADIDPAHIAALTPQGDVPAAEPVVPTNPTVAPALTVDQKLAPTGHELGTLNDTAREAGTDSGVLHHVDTPAVAAPAGVDIAPDVAAALDYNPHSELLGDHPDAGFASEVSAEPAPPATVAERPPEVAPPAPPHVPVVASPLAEAIGAQPAPAPEPVAAPEAPTPAPEPVSQAAAAVPAAAPVVPTGRVLEGTRAVLKKKPKSGEVRERIAELQNQGMSIGDATLQAIKEVNAKPQVVSATQKNEPRMGRKKKAQIEAGETEILPPKEAAKRELQRAREALADRVKAAIDDTTPPELGSNTKTQRAYAQQLVDKAQVGDVSLSNLPADARPELRLIKQAVQAAKGALSKTKVLDFIGNDVDIRKGGNIVTATARAHAPGGASFNEEMGALGETGTGPSKGAVQNVAEEGVLSGIERKQRIEKGLRRNPQNIREARDLRRIRESKPATAEEARAVATQIGIRVATDKTGQFTVEQAPKRRTAATLRGNDPAKGKRESGQATAKTAVEARKSLIATETATDVPVRSIGTTTIDDALAKEGAKQISVRDLNFDQPLTSYGVVVTPEGKVHQLYGGDRPESSSHDALRRRVTGSSERPIPGVLELSVTNGSVAGRIGGRVMAGQVDVPAPVMAKLQQIVRKAGAEPTIFAKATRDGMEVSADRTGKNPGYGYLPIEKVVPTPEVPVQANLQGLLAALQGVSPGQGQARVTTVGSLIRDPAIVVPQHVSGINRLMHMDVASRLRQHIAKVPVHILDSEEFERVYDEIAARTSRPALPGEAQDTNAFYRPSTDEIYMRTERVANQKGFAHDLLHEGTHALYSYALRNDKAVQKHIRSLMDAVERQFYKESAHDPGRGLPYGLTDEHEFLSEAWSNPEFQNLLHRTIVPEGPTTALGARLTTAWRSLLLSLRTALFGARGKPEHITALDSIVQATRVLEQSHEAGQWRTYPSAPLRSVGRTSAADITTRARNEVSDTAHASRSIIRRLGVRFATTQMIDDVYGRIWGEGNSPVARMREAFDAMGKTRDKALAEAGPHLEWLAKLQRSNVNEADVVAALSNFVTRSNINVIDKANATLQDMLDANPHLGGLKSDDSRKYQARARLMDAQVRFMALSPETREGFIAASKYFSDTQNRNTRAVVDKLLEATHLNLTEAERDDLRERTMRGKLTEADKAAIADDSIFNALVNAQEFRRIEGMYFPQLRYGNHVVLTRDDPGNLHGGTFDPETGVIEWRAPSGKDKDARAMYAAYAREQAARGDAGIEIQGVGKKRFLKSTGEEVSEVNARGQDHIVAYRALVQTKGVYMFESPKKAAAFAREARESGTFTSVGKPQLRDELFQNGGLSSNAVNGIVRAVNARQDIDKAHKNIISGILQEASARQLSGNRMQQRALPRRKVRGASNDLLRNILTYAHAASSAYARTRHMDDVRGPMAEMREYHRTHSDASTPDRQLVIDELSKRLIDPTVSKTGESELVRHALALSFMYRLGSPAYSVVNGMQVGMETGAVLGGRFGYLRTTAALSRAYWDIGFHNIIGQGITNSIRATPKIMTPLFDTRDPVQSIMRTLDKAPDRAFLQSVIQYAVDRGKIGENAGMEINQLGGAGKGKVKRAIAGADRIFRQMPSAVEAVNRSVTMITAARLALAADPNRSEEAARDFAFQTMMNTQGDYSAGNNPRFLSQKAYSPVFQFKKYAVMEASLLADMVRRSFNGATPEEKRVAWKQLGGRLMVQGLMAGMIGMPGVEFLKVAATVFGVLGIGDGWDDYERKFRRLLDRNLGKTVGEYITNGFSRALDVDLSSRLSLSDFAFFGSPKGNKRDDVLAYLAGIAIGAPGGMTMDWMEAFQLAGDGEFVKAATKIFPVKVVDDFAKAVKGRFDPGVDMPLTNKEMLLQTFGFRSGRMAEEGFDKGEKISIGKKLDDEAKKLKRSYITASSEGEALRLKAGAIAEHNKRAEEAGKPKLKVGTKGLDAIRKDKEAKRRALLD
jgi:hypothetical protein